MTNKQSWGDNWKEEFDKKFKAVKLTGKGWSYGDTCEEINDEIKGFIFNLLTSKSEQMEGGKSKHNEYCEHLENKDMPCDCGVAEYNAGISACQEILKK